MSVIAMLSGMEVGDEAAFRYAVSLARRMERPLKGLCALPDPASALLYTTSPYMVGVGGAAMESVQKAQNDLVESWRQMFDKIVAEDGGGIAAQFEHRVALTERAAADAATLADAIVFPRAAGRAGHGLSRAFEHVLMDTGLPVVLAGDAAQTDGPVSVAWDASPQAARALRMHMPLARLAGQVVIAQNPDDLVNPEAHPSADPTALAAWLGERDIKAETADFSGEVGEGLLALAAQKGASTLVAGAYGHSRAGEFFFGGATRTLLNAETAPTLALIH